MDEPFIERLRLAIKESGLRQKEFAEKSGISAGYLTDILKGRTIPSERVIKGICSGNTLNERWLSEGAGDMRSQKQKQPLLPPTLADIVADSLAHCDTKKLELSEGAVLLVKLYNQMTPEDQRDIITQAAMRVIAMGVVEPKE